MIQLKRSEESKPKSSETIGQLDQRSSVLVTTPRSKERGVALFMVIFVVALATIIVLQVTDSTFFAARQNLFVERGLQAEYLLKSGVNLARGILEPVQNTTVGPQDNWAKFRNGISIPGNLLEIDLPNVQISLQIRPYNDRIDINDVVRPTSAVPDRLVRLFSNPPLSFNDDEEEDQTGLFPGKVFSAEEMVANLIDFQDADSEDFAGKGRVTATGIESRAPEGYVPNTTDAFRRFSDLAIVPGFTPKRMQKMAPFVKAYGDALINVNLAPKEVLYSLDDDVDQVLIDRAISFRESQEGPYSGAASFLQDAGLPQNTPGLTTGSKYFEIIAKVEFESASYFARAAVQRDSNQGLHEIRFLELY